MIRLQLVVPVRDENEASRSWQPAAQEPKKVQARLVGPVVVLEHEHRPGSPKLVEQRGGDLVRTRVSCQQLRELASDLRRNVRDGRKRAGREEGVTRSGEDTGAVLALGGEGADERGLTAARLGADQDEPPALLVRLSPGLA